MGATIELGAVSARHPSTRVRCPPALPERIETEPGDEVGAAFNPMTAGAYSRDKSGAQVDAVGDRQAEPCLDPARTGENPVDPALELEGLLIDLRAGDRRAENGEYGRAQPKT